MSEMRSIDCPAATPDKSRPSPIRSPAMKHVLLCAAHMWGHIRPLSILAARMLQSAAVTITLVVATKYSHAVRSEILSALTPSIEPGDRLRFVSVEQGSDPFDPAVYEEHLLALWDKILAGSPAQCTGLDSTSCTFNLLDKPLNAAVIDVILVESFNALRKRRGNLPTPFKIFTWLPVAINSVLTLCRFDAIPLVEASAAQAGMTFNDAARQLMLVPRGEVMHCPGLPAMYDHEYQPQAFPMPAEQCGRIYIRVGRILQQTDGVLTFDAADYYPEAVSVLREWLAETSRKVYYTGPLVQPKGALDFAKGPGEATKRDGGVLQFLDNQLARRGECSVIYISFGSLFWPSDPTKVHAVLEVLIEKDIPFILAHSSPLAVLNNDTMTMLGESENAIVTDWAPQQTVLGHPATGWCLTHGGHNTVLECILAGIPMIVWPIFTDQPVNAIHLTDDLRVAYELLEVRHGTGLGPVYRTGKTPVGTVEAVREEINDVLERAFGVDGQEKRERLQDVRKVLARAWDEGGSARMEVEALLADI
ncbi:UDP-Glycosyltransferase/glycogen phosphorylase [Trametes polyzona]|nr:UDP-Glycosyltransferase/glycogen phosphorylase [Trametes polyzona]